MHELDGRVPRLPQEIGIDLIRSEQPDPFGPNLLGCWLRDCRDQVWLFTTQFAAGWTNNYSEQAVKTAKRHQAVSAYRHTARTLARWCRVRSYLDSARTTA